MKLRVHFNRHAKDEKVWSIRTSKGCYHVKKVIFLVPVETEFNPNLKNNPRAFLVTHGKINMWERVAYIEKD